MIQIPQFPEMFPQRFGIGGKAAADSLLTGLLAYYKLDEASGNAIDTSGNNYTLTQSGNPLGVAGKVGNARQFVAASFQKLTSASFQMPDTDFSIGFWFKQTTLVAGAFQAFIGNMTDSSHGQFFVYTYDLQAYFLIYSSSALLGNQAASTFGNLSTDTWYFCSCTRNKATGDIKIGINLTWNTKSAPGIINPIAGLQVGTRSAAGAVYLNGLLDEIGIWNRILTNAEWTRLYNA